MKSVQPFKLPAIDKPPTAEEIAWWKRRAAPYRWRHLGGVALFTGFVDAMVLKKDDPWLLGTPRGIATYVGLTLLTTAVTAPVMFLLMWPLNALFIRRQAIREKRIREALIAPEIEAGRPTPD
jgi:hypothetical protein